MPKNEHVLDGKKSSTQRMPVQPEKRNIGVQNPLTYTAVSIHKAQLVPLLLESRDILRLQRTLGNQAVGSILGKHSQPPSNLTQAFVLQRKWISNGKNKYSENDTGAQYNADTKAYQGPSDESTWEERELSADEHEALMKKINADLGTGEEEITEESIDYTKSATLADGAMIDYPALVGVMDAVTIGEAVAPKVWRKMRQDLCKAITLTNKSHPAHGSNFNSPQRPEVQIKDCFNPIKGPLKEALIAFFKKKYEIDLE